LYAYLEKGYGNAHPLGDTPCDFHYRGTLITGEEFDSSYKRGKPAEFTANGVVPGCTEGYQLMVEGDKVMMWVPSELAYGDGGIEGLIPPGAVLCFEVHLVKIKGPTKPKMGSQNNSPSKPAKVLSPSRGVDPYTMVMEPAAPNFQYAQSTTVVGPTEYVEPVSVVLDAAAPNIQYVKPTVVVDECVYEYAKPTVVVADAVYDYGGNAPVVEGEFITNFSEPVTVGAPVEVSAPYRGEVSAPITGGIPTGISAPLVQSAPLTGGMYGQSTLGAPISRGTYGQPITSSFAQPTYGQPLGFGQPLGTPAMSGFAQPAFGQPLGAPVMSGFAQPGLSAPVMSGFAQPAFGQPRVVYR
jgi:hypothetical protein